MMDLSGRLMIIKDFPVYASRSYIIDGFDSMAQGVYYLKVITDAGGEVFKMIRLRR
jgi:hypothetical protein